LVVEELPHFGHKQLRLKIHSKEGLSRRIGLVPRAKINS
jgi:hypothetical protein